MYQPTVLVPIFLGLLNTCKALIKSVTPKLVLLVVKNSIFIKARQLLLQSSTHFFVMSHKPWRQSIRLVRLWLTHALINTFRRYLQSPLWIRALIALVLLVLTASSSYLFIALLIIPQPIINWLQHQFINTLNKLGVARFFKALWRFLVPETLRSRWLIYQKWTIGRRQVRAAKRMRVSLAKVPRKLGKRPTGTTTDSAISAGKNPTE